MDWINGSIEMLGAVFMLGNIRAVCRDKHVAGVNPLSVGFFTAWGLWNLAYYPSLEQWFSFVGGIALVTANGVWLAQLVYYSKGSER